MKKILLALAFTPVIWVTLIIWILVIVIILLLAALLYPIFALTGQVDMKDATILGTKLKEKGWFNVTSD